MARGIVGIVALALVLVGPLVYAGPQLMSDLAAGQRWELADDLAIRESKCTRWYYLVSTCRVEYVHRQDSGRVGGTLSYLVFGSWSGERVRLLRSLSDPNQVGTTLGMEHMQQRLLSFGVFAVAAFAVGIGLLLRLLRTPRSASPAAPSAVEVQPARAAGVRTFGQRTSQIAG